MHLVQALNLQQVFKKGKLNEHEKNITVYLHVYPDYINTLLNKILTSSDFVLFVTPVYNQLLADLVFNVFIAPTSIIRMVATKNKDWRTTSGKADSWDHKLQLATRADIDVKRVASKNRINSRA
jgi:hypothetical protein